jgi:peptidoglycan biosynthesis protein MviN/MurJ (putative lipid II flippase)
MHDTKIPMYSSIAAIFVSIILGFVLSRSAADTVSGISSLALAYSIGSWLNLLLLAILLNKKIILNWNGLLIFILKVIVLTLLMGVAMQYAKVIVSSFVDIDRVRFLALQMLLALVVGAAVYLGAAWLLGFKEIKS